MADSKVDKVEEVLVCEKDAKVEKEKKVDKDKKVEKKIEEVAKEVDEKCEKKADVENGDATEKEENGKEEVDEEKKDEKSCAKRKSAGGDAPDGTPAEEVSPEKKQKVDETAAEPDSKEETELAA